MPKAHDLGGSPADEPIDRNEHRLSDWEWRTHALARVLVNKGIITTDELRRGIENLSTSDYKSLSYYERWSASLESLLVKKGTLKEDEIDEAASTFEVQWGQRTSNG